jgi:hypothetical protein
MDRLEEYIKNNRDDLDIYKPSPFLWKRISPGLKSDRLTARRWISVAASVAVLIATSVIFYHIGKEVRDSEGSFTSGRVNARVSPELKEAEAYYNKQVNMLFLEAAPLLTGNPDLKRELNYDISRIDSLYFEIRKDLKDNIANQEVVEALIQNYLIKIEILEEVLAILKENENNTEKNRSHEL